MHPLAAPQVASSRRSEGDSDDPESEDNAPNLLGGAYDSSDDDNDDDDDNEMKNNRPSASTGANTAPAVVGKAAKPTIPKRMATAASPSDPGKDKAAVKAGVAGEQAGESQELHGAVAEPDDAKRIVIAKMVGFVARNGQVFEDRVKAK